MHEPLATSIVCDGGGRWNSSAVSSSFCYVSSGFTLGKPLTFFFTLSVL